jgi:hypothetical protein
MARFSLEMDIPLHDHSPTAHRAVIGQMLGQVVQAVGNGHDDTGDIVKPPGGAEPSRTIGSWKIEGMK